MKEINVDKWKRKQHFDVTHPMNIDKTDSVPRIKNLN